MPLLFKNNASSTLATGIGAADLSIVVAASEGAKFPALGAGEEFVAVLEDSGGNYEVVTVTARSGDTLTVVRAQEGTTAQVFSAGTRIENRMTAGTLSTFVQSGGGAVTGDFAVTGRLSGDTLRLTAGADADIAKDGNDAVAIGGKAILTAPGVDFDPARWTFQPGMIVLWSGSIASIPAGWALCDGTSGIVGEDGATYDTPDLSNRFVIGAGSSFNPDQTGGSLSPVTDAQGAHAHSGVTNYHTLSISEIPSHVHNYTDRFLNWSTVQAGNSDFNPQQVLYNAFITSGGYATNNTGGGGAHRHGISTDGSHAHNVGLPAYYALAYIMKIG